MESSSYFRVGNWLSADECSAVIGGRVVRPCERNAITPCWPCCLAVTCEDRNWLGWKWTAFKCVREHWAVVDLIEKGRHIRTVPIPLWVKAALDEWTLAAGITEGTIVRPACQRKSCKSCQCYAIEKRVAY